MDPHVISLSGVAVPGYYSEFLRVPSMSLGLFTWLPVEAKSRSPAWILKYRRVA